MLRTAPAKAAKQSRALLSQNGPKRPKAASASAQKTGQQDNEHYRQQQHPGTEPGILIDKKPTRARSFLLDPPKKPASKRLSSSSALPSGASSFERRLAGNPYASILATPIRQCLYTRKILPSAFLTKLIQAAPDSPGDRVWIVPEQIIPYELSKETNSGQALDRFGMGKWMFSGSNLVQSMVKEGKYKMINSSAYVRPDLAQLIYAQWTMRVVHNTLDMCKRATGNPPFVILTKEPSAIATTPDAKPEVLQRLTDETHHNAYLQCVLRFESDTDVATSFGNSEPQEPSVDLIPNLPSFSDRSLVQEDVKILRKGGKTTVVPMYNMKYLLGNHPQGLRAVHQAFLKRIPAAEGSAEDSNQRWIGLVESPQTVDTAVGLWKLASMMPRQSK